MVWGRRRVEAECLRWVEGPGLVEGGGSAIGGGGNGTLSAFAALGTGRLPWGCLGCFSKLQPFPPNLGSIKF